MNNGQHPQVMERNIIAILANVDCVSQVCSLHHNYLVSASFTRVSTGSTSLVDQVDLLTRHHTNSSSPRQEHDSIMSLSRPSKNFSTNSSYHNFPRSEICGAHTPVSNSIIKSKSLSSGLLYCYAVSIIVTWNNTLRFFIANCLKGMVKAKYNSQFCVHL